MFVLKFSAFEGACSREHCSKLNKYKQERRAGSIKLNFKKIVEFLLEKVFAIRKI